MTSKVLSSSEEGGSKHSVSELKSTPSSSGGVGSGFHQDTVPALAVRAPVAHISSAAETVWSTQLTRECVREHTLGRAQERGTLLR